MHANFAKKQQTASQNVLFTRKKLQGMMAGTSHYALDTMFPYITVVVDKNLSFMERCDSTWMSTSYDVITKKMPLDQKVRAWVETEIVRLWSETWKFNSVVERIFPPHR